MKFRPRPVGSEWTRQLRAGAARKRRIQSMALWVALPGL